MGGGCQEELQKKDGWVWVEECGPTNGYRKRKKTRAVWGCPPKGQRMFYTLQMLKRVDISDDESPIDWRGGQH